MTLKEKAELRESYLKAVQSFHKFMDNAKNHFPMEDFPSFAALSEDEKIGYSIVRIHKSFQELWEQELWQTLKQL